MKTKSGYYDDLEVVVFVKPACVQCDATFKAIRRLEIDYGVKIDCEVVDVSSDTKASDFVQTLGYLQLPVVIVARPGQEDKYWSAFRPDRIKRFIGPRGLFHAA